MNLRSFALLIVLLIDLSVTAAVAGVQDVELWPEELARVFIRKMDDGKHTVGVRMKKSYLLEKGKLRLMPAIHTPLNFAHDAPQTTAISPDHPYQVAVIGNVPYVFDRSGRIFQLKAVEQAVQDSVDSGIAKRGKEVTPWILARVKELTGGTSVESSELAASASSCF